ncbi:DUF697 domain-containing protein [Fulvivirga sp. RKSG066]|uniref:DUF697 domain-containing protein n=1 Tax=Fulvivirga aurantia TaxID=2529383 RepID=UPI0012BC7522|nr:DUF697 domain-containing protein [Fulvivirga aurantia]MTI22445.1 DUF697 domain-containing protein [Fulvivirga aurantia]
MTRYIKRIGLPLAVGLLLIFLLFAANQLIALYANLSTINEWLAITVTSLLTLTVFILFSLPFVLILKLPSSISYEERPDVYKKKLLQRLSKNKRIKKASLNVHQPEDLEKALAILDKEAQQVIKQTATSVFLTTAISQNGKLDALTVLITQSRMVWKVAHIYWQRPTVKDMLRLYGNVAAAGLVASEIEDIDISRQVEPVINALLKSPGRSIPVVGHAAHIITDSLLEGSTNAFLTLRVGIITQNYCGALNPDIDKRKLRKNAFVEASGLLKTLVVESSGKVVKSVMQAMKDAGRNTVKSSVDTIGKTAKNVGDSVGGWFKKKERLEKNRRDEA